ncbi:MAG: precorrin-6A/cobalt-precorrin-6A reductase, partial [Alphaproteobacteria bacterium]
MTILLLGGTRDAIKIGESLTCQYIYSIAGVTDNPSVPNNATVHTGGFSAIGGLQKFIADNNITTVINATHPYASAITETVNNLTDVNVIRYLRPAWEIQN